MALNISKATIGYDRDQLTKTYNNLRANCIQDTIRIMQKNTKIIYDFVNQAWVGQSADQFKQNWENDVYYIVKRLGEAETQLKNQFDSVVKTMNKQENTIVQKRSGGR